jgi:hypothetical protein
LPAEHRAGALRPESPALGDHPDQVTVPLRAGDAALVDYRALHGTHPHGAATTRACLILNFTPDWAGLPEDVRGHLIRGNALPTSAERGRVRGPLAQYLPTFAGVPRDLTLSRDAPAVFAATRQTPGGSGRRVPSGQGSPFG